MYVFRRSYIRRGPSYFGAGLTFGKEQACPQFIPIKIQSCRKPYCSITVIATDRDLVSHPAPYLSPILVINASWSSELRGGEKTFWKAPGVMGKLAELVDPTT